LRKLPKACIAVLDEPVQPSEMAQMCPTVSDDFGKRMVRMAESLGLSPMETIEISGWAHRTGGRTGVDVGDVLDMAARGKA
jgi:hypothetical protein